MMPDLTPEQLVDVAWQRLSTAARDRTGAAQLLALATGGTAGPAVRTVVLRSADREAGRITVWTNRLSSKMADIAADPRAEAMAWDDEAGLQIRLRLRLFVEPGPRDVWDGLPDDARANYKGPPPPGSRLAAPEAFDEIPARFENFVVLSGAVVALDLVLLDSDLHRRVLADADGARWVVP